MRPPPSSLPPLTLPSPPLSVAQQQQSLLPEMTLWGETAKLLWRVRENLVVRFYHHDAPPTIAVVAHNEATSEVRTCQLHRIIYSHGKGSTYTWSKGG